MTIMRKWEKGRSKTILAGLALVRVVNERVEGLHLLCIHENLVISNTMLELAKRRLKSWKGPEDNNK